MKKDWILPEKVDAPTWARGVLDDMDANAQAIIGGMLVRRGVADMDAALKFLYPHHYRPAPPDDLPDMAQAVARMQRAIADGEKILVWGDFDVDGQTSTALLVSALRGLGGDVAYYIPQRGSEGHGIFVPKLAGAVGRTAHGRFADVRHGDQRT